MRVRSLSVISFTLAVVLVTPACDQSPPLVADTRDPAGAASPSGEAAGGSTTAPSSRARPARSSASRPVR